MNFVQEIEVPTVPLLQYHGIKEESQSWSTMSESNIYEMKWSLLVVIDWNAPFIVMVSNMSLICRPCQHKSWELSNVKGREANLKLRQFAVSTKSIKGK
jgi:hypothetical protein